MSDITISPYAQTILDATVDLATAVAHEMLLEDTRHVIKFEAISRIMAAENKLTGKPHSFSSAEATVHVDAEYASHLESLRKAAVTRIVAKGTYEAAIANARLQQETHA